MFGLLKAVCSLSLPWGPKGPQEPSTLLPAPGALSLNTVVINSHHSESGVCVCQSVTTNVCVCAAAAVVIDQAVVVKSHHF